MKRNASIDAKVVIIVIGAAKVTVGIDSFNSSVNSTREEIKYKLPIKGGWKINYFL